MKEMTPDDWETRWNHFANLVLIWTAVGLVGIVGMTTSLIVSYPTGEKLQLSISPINWLNILFLVSIAVTLVSVSLIVYYSHKRDKFQKNNPKPARW